MTFCLFVGDNSLLIVTGVVLFLTDIVVIGILIYLKQNLAFLFCSCQLVSCLPYITISVDRQKFFGPIQQLTLYMKFSKCR